MEVIIKGQRNVCFKMIDLIAQTSFGNFKAIKTLDISKLNVDNNIISFSRELMFSKDDQKNFELSVIYISTFGYLSVQRKIPLANVNIDVQISKIGDKNNKISVKAQTDENGFKTVYFLLPKGQNFDDIDYNGQKNGYWSSDCSHWYQGQFLDKKEVPNIPKFTNYEENIYIFLDIAIIKFIFQAIVQNQYGQIINDALMIISIEDALSNEQEQLQKQTKSYPSGQLWIEMLYQPLSKIKIKESIMAKGYVAQDLQFEQTFNFSQRVEQYIHDFGVITLYKSDDQVQIIITGRIIAQFYCKGLLKWKGLQGVKIQVKMVNSKPNTDNFINTESILNLKYVSLNDFLKNQFNTDMLTSQKWKNRILAHNTERDDYHKKEYLKAYSTAVDSRKDEPKEVKKDEPKDSKKDEPNRNKEKKQKKKDKRKNKNYNYSDEDGYFFFRKTSKRGSVLEFKFKKHNYWSKSMQTSISQLNRQPDDSYFGYLQKIRMERINFVKKAKCPSTDSVDDE
ncbi:unnamed protein product [Paramecium sonneborni]|uniref:Uncharacterized protein n=1 Tax=Paramecium sonneborni TaxID=65129 RepID=A0A8S1QV23_9CILI|nr:unnamed protein product [Paramecium sonneborni]